MRKQTGFTIVELLIAIALIATVSAIAIPSFIGWLPDYRLRSAAQDLLSNFQKGKLTAVKRNTNTAVCFSSSGYTIFLDPNTNFVNDAEEVVAQVNWADYKSLTINLASISFDTSPANVQPCIAFRPTGIPVDDGGGTATCDATLSNTKGTTKNVMVSVAGGVYIQ